MPAVPFPYIGNVVRVVMRARRDGNERISVLYYECQTGSPTEVNVDQLVSDVEDTVGPAIAGITCLGTEFIDVQGTDITRAESFTYTKAWSDVASGGSDVLPANVALTFLKRTGLAGRSHRGRFYAYDLSEDLFAGSTVNPLSMGPVNALAAALMAPLSGGLYKPVVASHTYGTTAVITSVTTIGIAGTMSKRLPGRGS